MGSLGGIHRNIEVRVDTHVRMCNALRIHVEDLLWWWWRRGLIGAVVLMHILLTHPRVVGMGVWHHGPDGHPWNEYCPPIGIHRSWLREVHDLVSTSIPTSTTSTSTSTIGKMVEISGGHEMGWKGSSPPTHDTRRRSPHSVLHGRVVKDWPVQQRGRGWRPDQPRRRRPSTSRDKVHFLSMRMRRRGRAHIIVHRRWVWLWLLNVAGHS